MKILTASVLTTLLFSTTVLVNAGQPKIGASLNEKYDIELHAIPHTAITEILKIKPDFIAKEAEKELKQGKTYLDIEGIDGQGNEIEFDMLQKDGAWKVVEVQRDLTLAQCPKNVVAALPNISPKRIIESDQTNGIVVYEFYTVAEDGKEKRYEVKLEDAKAELLTKAWQH